MIDPDLSLADRIANMVATEGFCICMTGGQPPDPRGIFSQKKQTDRGEMT